MDEKNSVKTLKQVKKIFNKHNIEFWLDFGTLLGCVRDGKFIPWDHDIDLGAWSKESYKIESACEELQNIGFEINIEISSNIPLHVTVKEKYQIDIFLYHLKYQEKDIAYTLWKQPLGYMLHYLQWIFRLTNDKQIERTSHKTRMFFKVAQNTPLFIRRKIINFIWYIQSIKMKDKYWSKNYRVTVPSKYFTNLSTIKFYEMEFKIPNPIKEYLEYRYGKDWQTPKKNYEYSKE